MCYPLTELSVIRHEPDNRFLECALAANAEFIVTVNTAPGHFDRKQYQAVGVARPQRIPARPGNRTTGEEAHSRLIQPSLRRLIVRERFRVSSLYRATPIGGALLTRSAALPSHQPRRLAHGHLRSKRRGCDLDVFGDGTVVVMSTPGHTPGHQVLFVKLAKRGPVVLGGDLYHYPEERTTGKIPTFEFNAEQSKASRAKIEAFLKQNKAELWIEHDMATHAKLPKAPAFIE